MFNLKFLINKKEDRSSNIRKNIYLSFINKGIAILVSLQLIPLTIDYVNVEQYGIWLTLSSIVTWAAYFDLGLGHGFRNRFAEAKAENNIALAQKYVSTTYAILSIIFCILFVTIFLINLFIDWKQILNLKEISTTDLNFLFILMVGIFCIQSILNTFLTLLLADQRPAFSSMITTLGQLFALLAIYFLTKNTHGNLILLSLTLSGIPCIWLLIVTFYMFKHSYKQYSPSITRIDFSLLRRIIGLGGKFFIIQISILLIFQCSNIILSRITGPESVTIYNITYKYFNVIYMVAVIFLTPFWSAFTDAYIKHDLQWMRAAYSKLSKYWFIAILGYVIMLGISSWVYKFWLGSNIHIPFSMSLLMGLYILIMSRAGLYMQLINGIGKVQIQLYVYVLFAFISIPFMTMACKSWGSIGVIIIGIIVYSIQSLLGHIQLHKILNGDAKGIWNK